MSAPGGIMFDFSATVKERLFAALKKSGRGRKWRMFLRRERGDTRSILSFLFLY
jgi:hypothetical protein